MPSSQLHRARFSRLVDWVEYFFEVTREGTKVTLTRGRIEAGTTTSKVLFVDRFPDEDTADVFFSTQVAQRRPLWPTLHTEQVQLERPTVRFASNPTLERAVLDDERSDASAVFVDWLLEQGDPRGELALAAKKGGLHAVGYLAARPELLGTLDAMLENELRVTWKHGLAREVLLRQLDVISSDRDRPSRVAKSMAGLLTQLLDAEVFRVVTRVTLTSGFDVGAVAALRAPKAAQLRALGVVANGIDAKPVRALFETASLGLTSLTLADVGGARERGRSDTTALLAMMVGTPLLAKLEQLVVTGRPTTETFLAAQAKHFRHLERLSVSLTEPPSLALSALLPQLSTV